MATYQWENRELVLIAASLWELDFLANFGYKKGNMCVAEACQEHLKFSWQGWHQGERRGMLPGSCGAPCTPCSFLLMSIIIIIILVARSHSRKDNINTLID